MHACVRECACVRMCTARGGGGGGGRGAGGGGGGVRKTEDFWEAYTQSTGPGVSCPSHTSIIRLTHKALGPGYHAPLTTQSSALHTKNWARGNMPLAQLISFTHKAQGPGYHAPLTTQSSALHTKHRA